MWAYCCTGVSGVAHVSPLNYAPILNPFRTAVSIRGQTTQTLSSLYPKRDCGSKGVNITGCHGLLWYAVELWLYVIVVVEPRGSSNLQSTEACNTYYLRQSAIVPLLSLFNSYSHQQMPPTTVISYSCPQYHTWHTAMSGNVRAV